MTAQEKMQQKLATVGIPAKEIRCYGSQITIEAWSYDAAKRWAQLLAKFSNVKAVKESIDYNATNEGTNLKPTTHKVWRVWATI